MDRLNSLGTELGTRAAFQAPWQLLSRAAVLSRLSCSYDKGLSVGQVRIRCVHDDRPTVETKNDRPIFTVAGFLSNLMLRCPHSYNIGQWQLSVDMNNHSAVFEFSAPFWN